MYRGRGGLKLLLVVAVVWGTLSGAVYAMYRAGGAFAYIPVIVVGAGILIVVLLFKLLGPLS